MTGIDTNVLLRFILKDDPVQTPKARAVLRSLTPKEPGWIGLASILEIAWVLANTKNMDRGTVANVLVDLLRLDSVTVEQGSAVARAAQRFREGRADFADCLIAATAQAAGCNKTVTFDHIAARDAGMELIK